MIKELIDSIRGGVSDTVANVRNAGRRQADIIRGVSAKPKGALGRRFSAISRTGEKVLGTTPFGTFEKIGDRSR